MYQATTLCCVRQANDDIQQYNAWNHPPDFYHSQVYGKIAPSLLLHYFIKLTTGDHKQ